MRFEQINKDNTEQYQTLLSLWIPYLREICDDDETANETDEELAKYAKQRVNIQGSRNDLFFELVYQENECIGFAYYAVDLGGIKNLLEPGYGYIMEFYVKPESRRKGYATMMFKHIEEIFTKLHVPKLYLTPESKTGIPFWYQMGFKDSGLTDPDNHMPIYIKNNL